VSKRRYIPPEQSTWGQVFDSACLVALILSLMFGPLAFGVKPAQTIDRTISAQSWQALGQNEAMASAWERLGYTPETAKPLIASRFAYGIDLWTLAAFVAALLAYYFVLIRISRSEYRDVISERFDEDHSS